MVQDHPLKWVGIYSQRKFHIRNSSKHNHQAKDHGNGSFITADDDCQSKLDFCSAFQSRSHCFNTWMNGIDDHHSRPLLGDFLDDIFYQRDVFSR